MKIKINKSLKIVAVAAMSIFASCDTTEETDFALNEKPVVSAAETNFTVSEGEIITIPITIDEPINQPLTFKLLISEGATAENGVDYTAGDGPQSTDWGYADAGFSVIVPAYAESFEIPVTAFEDLVPQEGTETVQLVMTASGVRNAITEDGGIVFNINIEEVESDDFVIQLVWGETYTDESGNSQTFCDFDLDLELYNSAGEIVAASYSGCPEEIRITPGDLPDGTYTIVATYYSPNGSAIPVDFDAIPATVVLAQPGVSNQVVDMTALWIDFTSGYAEDAEDEVLDNPDNIVSVATLEISGTEYTLDNVYTPSAPAEGEGDGTTDGETGA